MSAERTRRALVTESEGQKSAAIISSEGERQAAITLAEGKQQAQVLEAEGERQAAILRAQGFSSGLGILLEVARHLDDKTLLLQYFDTLKEIGTSASTKFVVPMELSSLLSGIGSLVGASGAGDEVPPPPPPVVAP